MASLTLSIQEVEADAGRWELVWGPSVTAYPNGTRLLGLRDPVSDGSAWGLYETVDAHTMRLYFDDVPESVDSITAVKVRLKGMAAKTDTDVTLYIDGTSVGTVSHSFGAPSAQWVDYEAANWNGPWTAQQVTGAYVDVECVVTGAPNEYTAITRAEIVTTYTEKAEHEGRFVRADSLRHNFLLGEQVLHLGAPSGVRIEHVQPYQDKGVGVVEVNGTLVRYRSPGAAEFGDPVDVADAGYYLLEGRDPSHLLRIHSTPSFLPSGLVQEPVELQTMTWVLGAYNFDADEAASGATKSVEIALTNVSRDHLYNVKVWVDEMATGLSISETGSNYRTPRTEAETDVTWSRIRRGQSVTLYVKATVGPNTKADPRKPVRLCYSWDYFT